MVHATDLGNVRTFTEQDAWCLALVLAEEVRLPVVVAAEVEEPERVTVDVVAVAIVSDGAAVEIPVGDVVAGLLENVVFEQARHKVDPPLVREHHPRDVRQRLAAGVAPPPVEEFGCPFADSDEAEVVDAGTEDLPGSDGPVVAGNRHHRVRSDHDLMLTRQGGHVLEGTEHLDVWIEIDGVIAPRREQEPQQRRLHRGRQLGHVIDGRKTSDLRARKPDLTQSQTLERLVAGIQLSRFVVDEQHQAFAVGVVIPEGRRQHPRMRKVVPGDDCANCDHALVRLPC